MELRKKLNRNIAWVLVAALSARVIGFLQGFIIVLFLSPNEYGIWITANLFVNYTPIIALGTLETLLKKVPFYRGTGDVEDLETTENTIFVTSIWASIFLLGLTLLCAAYFVVIQSQELVLFVACMGLGASISMLGDFYFYRLSCYEDFRSHSVVEIVRAVIFLFVVIPTAWMWGVNGAALGFCLTQISYTIYAYLKNSVFLRKLNYKTTIQSIKTAIKIGFPITLVWWTMMIQMSVDRLVIASCLGTVAVGYYGFGMTFVNLFTMLGQVVPRVLYPYINRGLGSSCNEIDVEKLVYEPALALVIIFPIMQVLLICILPAMIRIIVPKYLPSVETVIILVMGAYFLPLVRAGGNFLIAKNKQNIFLGYILITGAIAWISNLMLLRMGIGIHGVASVTVAIGALLTTCVWISALRTLGKGAKEVFKSLFYLIVPFLIIMPITYGTHMLGGGMHRYSLFIATAKAILGCLIFLGGMLVFPRYRKTIIKMCRIGTEQFTEICTLEALKRA